MKYQYHLQDPVFTAKNIDIQKVSRPKDYRHTFKQGRGKHGFIYTVSGQVCDTFVTDEKQSIYSKEGELVFIPCGSIYSVTYLGESTEIKLVQFDIAEGTLPEYLSQPTKIELPRAGELIEDFFKPTENHIPNHPFYYLSCFYSLLWQIDESYSSIPKKYRKLRAALAEITEHSEDNHPISHYARLCDMSEVNFRRLVREYTGRSPIEYRNDIRLENAKNKLQSGEYNVSEVAELCGFSNLSFFIKLYKKKFGYTPKKE